MKTQISKHAILIYAKLIVEVIDALSKIDIKYPYKSTRFFFIITIPQNSISYTSNSALRVVLVLSR